MSREQEALDAFFEIVYFMLVVGEFIARWAIIGFVVCFSLVATMSIAAYFLKKRRKR